MDVVLVLSFSFLLSPLLGYGVVASRMSVRKKIVITVVGIALMIIIPLLVLALAGGSFQGGGNSG